MLGPQLSKREMQRDERTSLMATWWIRAVVCALFAVKKRKAVIGVVLKGTANKNGLIYLQLGYNYEI